MPSFFSKKSRSQAAFDGQEPAASQGGPYRPQPLDVARPHQQQQQQQQQPHALTSDYAVLANQTNISPTVPSHNSPFHPGQVSWESADHVVAVDPRAAARPSFAVNGAQPDVRDHRHPAHRVPVLQQPQPQQQQHSPHLSLDRPTINLVVPKAASPDLNDESASFNSSLDADKSSEHTSSLDLAEKIQSKLKKKGRFGLHSSPSSAYKDKQQRGLGRSLSVRHKSGLSLSQDELPLQQEQLADHRGSSNLLAEQGILQQGQVQHPEQQSVDPSYPTTTFRASEPFAPTSPQIGSPTQRLYADPLNKNTLTSYHQRAGSGDSFPSQSDMAATDRPVGVRPTAADSATQQTPVRRDSLAAPGGQGQGQSPYPQSGTGQASNFKGNISQQNLQEQQPGRETPPSAQQSKFRDDVDGLDVAALIQKHEELQMKYTKVKRYYFEKEAQVQQLQNTVAHQRMAVSRTVLDDNEYTARFNRLDGAIKDLAFSIRKEWKSVPSWLHPYVNEDAVSVGTKEMTAIGRAVISRWIVDEIFDRHFHPGLEANLSVRLKGIEANLRRQQVQVFSEEEKDNQVARISTWRRTTLDGLSDILLGPSAQENQTQLTDHLVEKLSASMEMDLKDPAPVELGRGVRMIVENAMGILEKVPLEARDICAEYFPPGMLISETTMKPDTGLPPLTRTIVGGSPSSPQNPRLSADRASYDSAEDMDTDKKSAADAETGGSQLSTNREGRKKYNFGNLISKMSSSQPDPPRPGSANNNKDRDGPDKQQQQQQQSRVRLSTFMAVEVRGKGPNNVLIKAPVFTLDS